MGNLIGLEMYGTASKPKHGLVSSLGATPIDYANEDFVERIFSLTGDGVDVVVDHVGGPHLKRSFKTLRAGGHLIVTSSYKSVRGEESTLETMWGIVQVPLWNILPNKKSALLFDIVQFNKKHSTWYAEDLKVLMGYLAEGKIKPVVAERMPLVEARQAQELILEATIKGKIILICSEQ